MTTLKIHISRDEVPHLTKTKPFIHVRKCKVKKGNEQIYLKELKRPGQSDKYTAVKLVLERRFINQRLFIPANVEKAIVWYMNHYPDAITTIDDNRFAYRVAGMQSTGSWNLKRTRRLRAGDQVFFMKETTIVQKAIYIGTNLCIMVWVTGGPLEVTGLHDIKQALGATHLVTWHPGE